MIAPLMTANGIIPLDIFLLYSISKPIHPNRNIVVYIAGNIVNAAPKCPSSTSIADRWSPQPGQSRPKNCLERHGSINFSQITVCLFGAILRKNVCWSRTPIDKKLSLFLPHRYLNMKKPILITSVLIAFGIAFYEQSLEKPNLIISVLCVVVFMLGIMQLSAKIPSKHKENEDGKI